MIIMSAVTALPAADSASAALTPVSGDFFSRVFL